jgi:hypothetical protein
MKARKKNVKKPDASRGRKSLHHSRTFSLQSGK